MRDTQPGGYQFQAIIDAITTSVPFEMRLKESL
jgi:hypothetical protein